MNKGAKRDGVRKPQLEPFPKRGDVFWVCLDPVIGSEINKKRPCLVVSNNLGNEFSSRVVVAPITSSVREVYPFEVKITLENREGKILLDQIRFHMDHQGDNFDQDSQLLAWYNRLR